jgi:hypothetical protein
VLDHLWRHRLRRQCQARIGIGLAARDFLRRGLAVGDRIEALHLVRHLAIGNRLNFERMQTAELGDLIEGQRGVFDQPYGGRLGHQGCGHDYSVRCTVASRPPARVRARKRSRSYIITGID